MLLVFPLYGHFMIVGLLLDIVFILLQKIVLDGKQVVTIAPFVINILIHY